jgi:hypothetical protein
MNYQDLLQQAQNSYQQCQMKQLALIEQDIDLKAVEADNPDFLDWIARQMNFSNIYKSHIQPMFQFYQMMHKHSPQAINTLANRFRQAKEDYYKELMTLDLSQPRLSQKELDEITIEERRRGEHIRKLDFCPFTDLLHEHYGICFNDLYGSIQYRLVREVMAQEFGLSEERIEAVYRESPMESEDAAILSVISQSIEHLDEYINHWHYMLDYHFGDFKRGGTNYMSVYHEGDKLYEPKDKPYHPLLRRLDQIYFSEARDYIDENECIAFEVDW